MCGAPSWWENQGAPALGGTWLVPAGDVVEGRAQEEQGPAPAPVFSGRTPSGHCKGLRSLAQNKTSAVSTEAGCPNSAEIRCPFWEGEPLASGTGRGRAEG